MVYGPVTAWQLHCESLFIISRLRQIPAGIMWLIEIVENVRNACFVIYTNGDKFEISQKEENTVVENGGKSSLTMRRKKISKLVCWERDRQRC